MNLGKRQEIFMRLLPRLIDKAHELNFEIRGGSLFRDPRLHGHKGFPDIMTWLEANYPVAYEAAKAAGYSAYGSRTSLHKDKCAIDLNLRNTRTSRGPSGMVWSTEGHRELGEWWEQQHELCRWGGHFQDGNHYEFTPPKE